jgi:fatty-acyl-CoA synthase
MAASPGRDGAESRHFAFWPEGRPRELAIPETSLWQNLEASARRFPARPAFVCYDSALTFAALEREATRLAGFLQQRCAVAKGDRVVLYAQNSLHFVVGYYAILRADAVVVPANPMSLTPELRHFVTDSGAKVAIVAQELWPRAEPLVASGELGHAVVFAYSDYLTTPTDLAVPDAFRAPRRAITGAGVTPWSEAAAMDLEPAPHTAGADDLCVMPYTSGTTGRPKGCMHTHRTVQSTVVGAVEWFDSRADDVSLAVLPFFHVTGMQNSMNVPVYLGSTAVILPRWDREAVGPLIARYRIHTWPLIPTMMIDFLARFEGKDDLSSLKRVSGGGAAMPEAIATKLKATCGLDFVEGYGLSETMAPSHINPPQRPKKQCLGIPIFGTDSRIVDPLTLEELPAGEVGEIVTSGPQVFLGYWNDPALTARSFFERDGKRFFRTGDLGRIDEDGYFFLVDRLKRMINASGFKVWPAEVEAALYGHPDIQEACVIGTQDARRGETVKAVVVLKPGREGQVSGADITAWAHGRMAAYKVPRVVQFVESLPKSGTGKVQWRLLQEQESESGARA